MDTIKLTNIPTPVPQIRVVDLLFELQCLYHEGVSAAEAYSDMEEAVKNGNYHSRGAARRLLYSAHASRDGEIAHIRDRIFTILREFFEPLEHGLSEWNADE